MRQRRTLGQVGTECRLEEGSFREGIVGRIVGKHGGRVWLDLNDMLKMTACVWQRFSLRRRTTKAERGIL